MRERRALSRHVCLGRCLRSRSGYAHQQYQGSRIVPLLMPGADGTLQPSWLSCMGTATVTELHDDPCRDCRRPLGSMAEIRDARRWHPRPQASTSRSAAGKNVVMRPLFPLLCCLSPRARRATRHPCRSSVPRAYSLAMLPCERGDGQPGVSWARCSVLPGVPLSSPTARLVLALGRRCLSCLRRAVCPGACAGCCWGRRKSHWSQWPSVHRPL
ncbi:hypothetical protein K491DRAFT_288039 [Lophiostoma macrostomum CBS 122681]|uniref:Uncharacterized protein n=1 Tax=Lophiostoma macrostomum CBS 122681 TaxID=1314788 RepID=A0A6A6TSC4_9PLEO|nr:hypothetical protein K491DRAFT_288039 [Lophiostoma macrostomum CBS 122681]